MSVGRDRTAHHFQVLHAGLLDQRREGTPRDGCTRTGMGDEVTITGEHFFGEVGLGLDTDGIVIAGRTIAGTEPVVFRGLTVRGPVVVDEPAGARPSAYEFHDARTADGRPLDASGFSVRHRTSTITIHTAGGQITL